jgi:hypothetical protein
MNKRFAAKIIKTFKFLLDDLHYHTVHPFVTGAMDYFHIEFCRQGSFPIRIGRERGYYFTEILIQGDWLSTQIVYRFLFPDLVIRVDFEVPNLFDYLASVLKTFRKSPSRLNNTATFEATSSLDDLAKSLKAQLPKIESMKNRVTREGITDFYHVHPTWTLYWERQSPIK